MDRYVGLLIVLLFTAAAGYFLISTGRPIEAGAACGMAALTFYFVLEDINVDRVRRQQALVAKDSGRDWE